jgi:hypothetical protein
MKGSSIVIGAVVLEILFRILSGLIFLPLVEIVLIGIVLPAGIYLEVTQRESRRKEEELDEKQPPIGVVQERIVTERVLVVCPFCSTKVEQGTSFCTNCGGKM